MSDSLTIHSDYVLIGDDVETTLSESSFNAPSSCVESKSMCTQELYKSKGSQLANILKACMGDIDEVLRSASTLSEVSISSSCCEKEKDLLQDINHIPEIPIIDHQVDSK